MNILSILKEEQKEYKSLLFEGSVGQDNSGASVVTLPDSTPAKESISKPTSAPRQTPKLPFKLLQQGSLERTIALLQQQKELEQMIAMQQMMAAQGGQPQPQMEEFNIKRTIANLRNMASVGALVASAALGANKSQTPPTPPPSTPSQTPPTTPSKPKSPHNNGELTADDLVDVGAIQGKMTETNPRQWYYGRAELSPDAAEAFKRADAEFFKQTGKHIGINSAYRSKEHQAALSKKHPVVAKPGHSQHGLGKAIDVQPGSPEFEWLKKNGAKFGWIWKNIKNDPCHFGFCGIPKPASDSKEQPATATTAPASTGQENKAPATTTPAPAPTTTTVPSPASKGSSTPTPTPSNKKSIKGLKDKGTTTSTPSPSAGKPK
ncbi:MAG: hypothetical protein EB127_02955 [Alphaproteobacteria bacterium]|nr:hypothetical protein [Alphaproteobacteria bacterium]